MVFCERSRPDVFLICHNYTSSATSIKYFAERGKILSQIEIFFIFSGYIINKGGVNSESK